MSSFVDIGSLQCRVLQNVIKEWNTIGEKNVNTIVGDYWKIKDWYECLIPVAFVGINLQQGQMPWSGFSSSAFLFILE